MNLLKAVARCASSLLMAAALLISIVPTSSAQSTADVTPILECVSTISGGGYSALFGYSNPNAFEVALPLGWANNFSPNPQDRGQPTTFKPGRQTGVFAVAFNCGSQVWTLNGKTVNASSSSVRCSTPTTVPTSTNTTVPSTPTRTAVPTFSPLPTSTPAPQPCDASFSATSAVLSS